MARATVRIALVGDYNPTVIAHVAIPKALELAGGALGRTVEPTWCGSAAVADWSTREFDRYDALWSVPNSPYKSMEGGLRAIRHARENNVPFLGTCGGFQYALIEYARNVLNIPEADHAESNPDARVPVISRMSCALVEKSGEVFFEPGSRIATIYGADRTVEEYHCRYGVNPAFEARLQTADLRVCGRDVERALRAVELPSHRFFIATLFQFERQALTGRVPVLVRALVEACANRAGSVR